MYLDEMKEFVGLHVKSQRIGDRDFKGVLDRIYSAVGDGPSSWVYEWMQFGEQCLQSQHYDHAIQCFNFARFPYVDSSARQAALDRCVGTFREHMLDKADVRRDVVRMLGLDVPVYSSLSGERRPLLIVLGGIVSIKEQWHKMLGIGRKLGYTVVVMECPGVGENPMRYGVESPTLISAIIDHYRERVIEHNVVVIGLSFGGHLAMRAALNDNRITRIVTAGAPINRFFTDKSWWQRVPGITKQTFAHIARCNEDALQDTISGLALDVADLRRLSLPVLYVMSLRDEIIPVEERLFLTKGIARLDLVEFDDVHGAPAFLPVVRQLILRELARHNNVGYGLLAKLLTLSIRVTKRRQSGFSLSTNTKIEGAN